MIIALASVLLGAPPLTVSLQAPPECPGYSALVRAIQRCGASPERPATAAVVVGSRPEGYVAEIALTLDGQSLGRRVIRPDAASCRVTIEAAAVSICIALDPTFVGPLSPSRAPEEGAPRARRGHALPAIALSPTGPPAADPPPPLRGGVSASAQLAAGALPSPLVIPRVGGTFGRDGWRLDLDLGVSPVVETQSDDAAVALQLVDVRLAACWSPGLVDGRAVRGVALRLCGATRAGVMLADGRGLERGRRRSGGHAELLAAVGMALQLGRSVAAVVDLEGGAAVWRTAFNASDENGGRELYRPALWVGGLVVSLRFEVSQ